MKATQDKFEVGDLVSNLKPTASKRQLCAGELSLKNDTSQAPLSRSPGCDVLPS